MDHVVGIHEQVGGEKKKKKKTTRVESIEREKRTRTVASPRLASASFVRGDPNAHAASPTCTITLTVHQSTRSMKRECTVLNCFFLRIKS
ncbi:Os06g0714951 [Oryza sativa Japonica Group]|uniref:Os06g0714951 protein n=1 Tax=Oryza sativa subsp. japonica TaxID=39947 RepID=A0A0P0X130_ORYSJ|nr:hypothetical protein EE612_036474 [Oryza sativa]BAS99490.1 Os06g0714951 [Oryza sativa Japonica Group]